MLSMLRRTRMSLELCKQAAKEMEGDNEVKYALFDAFTALILFWADTVHYMRDNPYGKH